MESALAVTMPAHPDADLLALAGLFIAHERLVQAMPCDAETDAEEAVQEAEHRRLLDHKHGLVMQMGELRATTADGIAARARCLAVHNADGAFSMEAPDTTTRPAAALAHAGRGGAGRLYRGRGGGFAGCRSAGGLRGVRSPRTAIHRPRRQLAGRIAKGRCCGGSQGSRIRGPGRARCAHLRVAGRH